MAVIPNQAPGPSPACLTCADQATVARVTRLLDGAFALVHTDCGDQTVSVALVDVREGDTVLVHAGEAITKLVQS
jgi:hydrogenase maturation factor